MPWEEPTQVLANALINVLSQPPCLLPWKGSILSALLGEEILYYMSLKLVVDMDTWGVHGFRWPFNYGPVSSQFMFSSQPDSCLLLCLPTFSTIFSTETSSSLLVGSKYWFGILSMQKEWKNVHQRPLKHFPIDIFWAEWKAA